MDLFATGAIAFFLAGFVKGVVGFGFPVVVLVILTLTTGLFEALAILIVPTLVTNIWQALSGPYWSAVMQRMWLYFVCAVAGILIASRFVTLVNVDLLTGLLGIVLLFFAMSQLLSYHVSVDRTNEPFLSVVLGTINGGLTGFTGSFMVPSVLYMHALGFSKDMLVQAMGMFFAISTLTLTIALGTNNLLGIEQLKLSVIALLPSFIGILAGRWARDKVDEKLFQKIFLAALLALGSYLLWRSAT